MRRCAFILIVTASCSSAADSETSGSNAQTAGPHYYEDAAPIFQEHCVSCHSPGNIAPFALETYEQARAVAGSIATETAARRMPPFHVDATGDCNGFRDARVLTDEEIATLAAWAKAGTPMGDPAHAPPAAPAPPSLTNVGATADPGIEYTPNASLADDYRCFIVDPGIAKDQFLTAYEVHPGEPSEVHHIVVFALDNAEDEQTADALDAAEEGPGYTCFGGSRTNATRVLIGWAPGSGMTRYPEGTGLRLSAGHRLVMQVHYNLAAGAKPDETRVDLELAPSVLHEATIGGVGDFDLNLTPGKSVVEEGQEMTLPTFPVPVSIYGVFPHMHKLGRTLRVDLERNGATSCIVNVPDYVFAWQQFYFYENPIVIPAGAGTSARIRCTYDTTGVTDVVHFGEGTGDEMCLAGLYAAY